MTEIVVKASVAMLLALCAVALARRSRASLRHGILAALFFLLLLLPFGSIALPKKVAVPVNLPAPIARTVMAPAADPATQSAPVAPSRSIDYALIAKTIYGCGVAVLLLSLGAGLWRLRRFETAGEIWFDGVRRATELASASGIRRAVLVLLSDEVSVPMTFGFRRQTIFLPADAPEWSADELDRALRHELEHVHRDDWMLQLVARVAAAFYWPHPLVWVALRRFCIEAERACDDAVIGSFEPASYASQLVSLARSLSRRAPVPVLAMASHTRLSERVGAILDETQERGPQTRIALSVTAAAMVAAVVAFGSISLVANAAANVRGGVKGGVEGGVRSGVDDEDAYSEVMIKAAETGNIRLIGRLLDQGIDVNESYDGDGTALLIAARNGRIDAMRYLLSRGADVNIPTPGDGNPLIAAAQDDQYAAVELLLDRGARIDEIVPGDESALMGACENGHEDIVALLISRGANVNLGTWVEEHRDGQSRRVWRSPLERARDGGHDNIERMLIAAGARK